MSQFDKWGVTMEAEEKAGPDPQKFGAFFQLDWSLPPTAAPFQCPHPGWVHFNSPGDAGRASGPWLGARIVTLPERAAISGRSEPRITGGEKTRARRRSGGEAAWW